MVRVFRGSLLDAKETGGVGVVVGDGHLAVSHHCRRPPSRESISGLDLQIRQ